MDAKAWIALVALAVTIGGGGTWLHQNFLTVAAAADLFKQESVDRERGDLEAQLKLALLELEYTEDEDRRDYLKRRILILEQRLLELEDDE